MSSVRSERLYPIMVIEDRYHGTYSAGQWWAVAEGDKSFEGMTRVAWLIERGPGADDVSCAMFWARKPPWIASGRTADAAVAALTADPRADSDDWTPPRWEDDPRAGLA